MSICSDLRELVETIFDDLDEMFEGTCLADHDHVHGNTEERTPEPGDIIGVDRGIYQHYGIFSGEDCVIHYTAEASDCDPENAEIQETSLERFLRDGTEFFILDPAETGSPWTDMFALSPDSDKGRKQKGKNRKEDSGPQNFSPEETLQRAQSRIGEHKYNLITNNCEHFVVWCKTGISDSRQVRQWAALCRRIFVSACTP